jgi:tripartite-type tricarboxylate transporter receptor subunit TctC
MFSRLINSIAEAHRKERKVQNNLHAVAKASALMCVLGAAVFLYTSAVYGQEYPTRPIRLVVPWPAGGTADLAARPIGQKLSEVLGQSVVIENVPGATGTIGARRVATAAPDGYTLLLGTTNELCMSPPLFKSLPYDPTASFAPITPVIRYPNVLVLGPSLSVVNTKDFIAFAKARPGQVNFASGGVGSTNHLTAELFKSLTKLDFKIVPYKGGIPAINDLLGGQIDALFATLPSVLSLVKAGQLRALLVTGEHRERLLSDAPDAAETGIPGLIVSTWSGVLAPAGTPPNIIQKLNAALVKIMQVPELKSQYEATGAEIYTSTPDEFSALIRHDFDMWSSFEKDHNIKVEQ